MDHSKKQGILVVIIAHNEFNCVKINLKILMNELKEIDSEVLVIDNCSKDGLKEWLVEQKNISYIVSDEVESYGKILSIVRQEFGEKRDVLLLRANYFFTPGSVLAMKAVLDNMRDVAAVGPISNGMPGEQRCSQVDTYEQAQHICRNILDEVIVRSVYLDEDVVMMKGNTFAFIDTGDEIPGIVMRTYRRKVLEQGYSFAVVKNAVCFAVCGTNNELYCRFHPKLYQQEQLRQLLYLFGDITYQGVHLYKYLEPEILEGLNKNNNFAVMDENKRCQGWNNDIVHTCTEEETNIVSDTLEKLPQKDVLFVSLGIRKFYQGKFLHTVLERYISSLSENQYMDLEYIAVFDESGINIPTKNRFCILDTAIPKLYGISQVNKQELFEFIWSRFICPLEMVMGVHFDENELRKYLTKASYILKQRSAFMEFYRRVLNKVKPKVVVYSHGQDMRLTFLREAAMECGIPTLEIAHGVKIRGTYHKQLVYADDLAVYSEIEAEQSRLSGNDRVLAIGKPGVYDETEAIDKSRLRIVIAFISSLEVEIFEYAKKLAEKLDKQKYLVVYKYHSGEIWSEQERKEIESMQNFMFADDRQDMKNILNTSDIVVGIRSTGILEALVYPMIKVIVVKDKAVFYNPDDFNKVFQEEDRNGEIVLVDDEEQLYREVLSYKRDTVYRSIPNQFWIADAEERFRALINQYILDSRIYVTRCP